MKTGSTPHARGSTLSTILDCHCSCVYPACAGIHRRFFYCAKASKSLPRMRGDPPVPKNGSKVPTMSTPHARGSTPGHSRPRPLSGVYPACAGIHPDKDMAQYDYDSLPRMRGDPPRSHSRLAPRRSSTPHARGSTQAPAVERQVLCVYPACAGIHPQQGQNLRIQAGLPRMRGDPPPAATRCSLTTASTPHARGSTLEIYLYDGEHVVYPACAGIHLDRKTVVSIGCGLPRMRGDPPR